MSGRGGGTTLRALLSCRHLWLNADFLGRTVTSVLYSVADMNGRYVIEFDSSGLGVGCMLAVASGAKHVHCVTGCDVAARLTRRSLSRNGVDHLCTVHSQFPYAMWEAMLTTRDAAAGARVHKNRVSTRQALIIGPLLGMLALDAPSFVRVAELLGSVPSELRGVVVVRQAITFTASLEFLPHRLTQCGLSVDLLEADPDAVRREEQEPTLVTARVPRADGRMRDVMDMMDLSEAPLLGMQALATQAWGIALTRAEVPGVSCASPSRAAATVDWDQLSCDLQRRDTDFVTLAELPFECPDGVASPKNKDEKQRNPLGRCFVIWASVRVRHMRGVSLLSNEPIDCTAHHQHDHGRHNMVNRRVPIGSGVEAAELPQTLLWVDDQAAEALRHPNNRSLLRGTLRIRLPRSGWGPTMFELVNAADQLVLRAS